MIFIKRIPFLLRYARIAAFSALLLLCFLSLPSAISYFHPQRISFLVLDSNCVELSAANGSLILCWISCSRDSDAGRFQEELVKRRPIGLDRHALIVPRVQWRYFVEPGSDFRWHNQSTAQNSGLDITVGSYWSTIILIPSGYPILGCLILLTLIAHGKQRRRASIVSFAECRRCGYDIRSSLDHRCSECGNSFESNVLGTSDCARNEPGAQLEVR